MSTPRDPVDRLRRANPLPLEEAPRADSAPARALFERIVETSPDGAPVEPRRQWLTGRRLWILIPAVVLAAGAATYGIFRDVTEPVYVACYQQPSLSAKTALVLPGDHGPAAACRPLWRPGSEFNPNGQRPQPGLEPCVLPAGNLGVFPSLPDADVCSVLGLAHPAGQGGREQENLALQRVQESLAEQFLSRCVGETEAVSLARAALQRNGITRWRVAVTRPFTKQEPCASLAVDAPARVIDLVPVGRG